MLPRFKPNANNTNQKTFLRNKRTIAEKANCNKPFAESV